MYDGDFPDAINMISTDLDNCSVCTFIGYIAHHPGFPIKSDYDVLYTYPIPILHHADHITIPHLSHQTNSNPISFTNISFQQSPIIWLLEHSTIKFRAYICSLVHIHFYSPSLFQLQDNMHDRILTIILYIKIYLTRYITLKHDFQIKINKCYSQSMLYSIIPFKLLSSCKNVLQLSHACNYKYLSDISSDIKPKSFNYLHMGGGHSVNRVLLGEILSDFLYLPVDAKVDPLCKYTFVGYVRGSNLSELLLVNSRHIATQIPIELVLYLMTKVEIIHIAKLHHIHTSN